MRSRSLFALAALLAVTVPTIAERPVFAAGVDAAARGLDVLIHAPTAVVGGASLPLDVRAYGFLRVTTAAPLPRATIRAAWDPESLGPNVSATLSDVVAVTDANGTAHLDVPVPAGGPRNLALLVAIESGEHSRVRKLEVQRTADAIVEIHVPDARVVPGSQVPGWVTVRSARTGAPVAGAPVEVALTEGDVPRVTQKGRTDGSGIFRAQITVPANVRERRPLVLRARYGEASLENAETTLTLSLREEVPGAPKVVAHWREASLRPGATGHATVRIADASGENLVGQRVFYWTGPRGTKTPETDAEWTKAGKVGTTDGAGELAITATAPRVVAAAGTVLMLAVRVEVEGQWLTRNAAAQVSLPTASATANVEGGALIPGLKQRVFLTIVDEDNPGRGDYLVEGDGVRARVTTDADGAAELAWNVPADIGGARQVGPCAGGVAATMVVRRAPEHAARPGRKAPFELCVPVDRDRTSLLRTNVQIATIGEKVHVNVDSSPVANGPSKESRHSKGATSFLVTGPSGAVVSTWSASTEADLDFSASTPGLHTITAVTPHRGGPASTVASHVLVRPRVLPCVQVELPQGKGPVAPGSEVTFDVKLDDGRGGPLRGTVTGVLIDREGGGSTSGFEALDTRASLCAAAQIEGSQQRCEEVLDNAPGTETHRRVALTTTSVPAAAPTTDPEATAPTALRATFSSVLHSLEGAVFEATKTPDGLRDVRRREPGRWAMNPELMTLVTSAMQEPPETPGGEPFALGDLLAVDAQVTFDTVARRVTRLKLFRVLSALRTFKTSTQVDADEPLMRDPASLLRRLVRAGTIEPEALIDPWGGTLAFARSAAPPTPFLTATQGWELRSPGPDGTLGNGDDVRDPFERVVRSGSAYATSMGEDEIVDAKWDMRVSESTVDNWTQMFDRLTGTQLGSAGEGLIGIGDGGGGGGGGVGLGHGSVGGSSRQGKGVVTAAVAYAPPVLTDASGRATIRMRVGDAETTWRAAIIARTEDGRTAVGTVDVSSLLPFSVRVDVGSRLVIGDAIGARVIVRNRLPSAQRAKVTLGSEGTLALAKDQTRVVAIEVPARSTRSFIARVDASSVGTGRVTARAEVPGAAADTSTQSIEVYAAAEARILMTSALVTNEATLAIVSPEHYVFEGPPRLVVESGFRGAFLAALEAVEPRDNSAPDALADAVEMATRIRKVAEATRDTALAERARQVAELAQLNLDDEPDTAGPRAKLARARAHAFALAPLREPAPPPRPSRKTAAAAESRCPTDAEIEALGVIATLETEPPPSATGPLACATALLSKVRAKTPLEAARVVAALVERPHRAALVGSYARDLARTTQAESANLAIEGARAEQAIIVAALLRSVNGWASNPTAASDASSVLLARLMSLRDGRGGYGSSEATRNVVRALVALPSGVGGATGASRVRVEQGTTSKVLAVALGAAQQLALAATGGDVKLTVEGGPIVARLEQPARRPWLGPANSATSPVDVTVVWPEAPRAATTDTVYVKYKVASGRSLELETRVTLPAGTTLAGNVDGVKLRQGFVFIRTTVTTEGTVALPIRFALSGRVVAPETETFVRSEDEPRATSPAQRLVVR